MKRTIIALTFTALTLVSCDRGPMKPDGFPQVYPVTLRLEQDDKPLSGADVMLVSDEIGKWSCGGVSNDNGIVTVRTHGQFSGAPLGRHKIIVSKIRSDAPEDDTTGMSIAEIREMEAQTAGRRDFGATVYLVERRFSNPLTTPLEVEVVAGKNSFTLDVGPEVEIVERRTRPL